MKVIVNTPNAPTPVGPYNQATVAGNFLFASGQIPFDPKTNALLLGDIESQTEQVMQNLKAVLQAEGLNFENVVKCTIFLSDMKNYSKVNEVYGKYFDDATAPARECVEVANLPKYVDVEISLIAFIG